MRYFYLVWVIGLLITSVARAVGASEDVHLFDTHIHYSHDAWESVPPKTAISILREAGIKQAFVSSSSDDGTLMLYREAPDMIVPVLRPYRKRGELGTWFRDETVVGMIEERLAKNTYAGIGEFHIFGDDANLPVMKHIVQLAKQYGIFLHAHADAKAVEILFSQNPDARVLWAHSGFVPAKRLRDMLKKYPNLRADLSFRSEPGVEGVVGATWRQLFLEFPDRFTFGTDTYTPERWSDVGEHATWSREWIDRKSVV